MVVLAGVVCSCDDKSGRLLVLYLSLNFHLLSVAGGGTCWFPAALLS